MKIKVSDMDLEQTLECGQCFNFEKTGENEYVISAKGKLLHVRQEKDGLEFINASEDEVKNIWAEYFDLNRDYKKIKTEIIKADPRLEPIIKEYYGIHILNQDFPETLMSFIISQTRTIPQIKKTVRALCENYGEYIGDFNGKPYYAFPGLKELSEISEEDYRALKTGFRAPYLKDAADKLCSGEISEEKLRAMSYEEAKKTLKKIKGVGDKVANCTLLFSLGFRSAFPVDTWIRKIIDKMYSGNAEYVSKLFGEYGGYAQQYLFMYSRKNF